MRLWRRRPREVNLYLPMRRIEHLFEAPQLDPFAPELEGYDPRPALERMVRAVQRAKRRATLSVTVGLPADVITPGLEERARAALSRECRRRIAMLDDDLDGVRRLGIRTLLWGLFAVLFINGSVGSSTDRSAPSEARNRARSRTPCRPGYRRSPGWSCGSRSTC